SLTRSAGDAIHALQQQKQEMITRVSELEELLDQERFNSTQRERLFESSQADVKARLAELEALNLKREDQHELAKEQMDAIERLKGELESAQTAIDQYEAAQNKKDETESELKSQIRNLEERLTKVTHERDQLRADTYQNEREEAQWSLKFTEKDRRKAVEAIDK